MFRAIVVCYCKFHELRQVLVTFISAMSADSDIQILLCSL